MAVLSSCKRWLTVALLLTAACSRTGTPSPPRAEPEEPAATQDGETAAPNLQGLVYDLRDVRQSIEEDDMHGHLMSRTYELADGTQIVVRYEWDGNQCSGATARAGDKIIATGKLKRTIGTPKEGLKLEVEELQYGQDGAVAYRSTSTFDYGYTDDKLGEWPEEGRKLYEVFLKWGRYVPELRF